MPAHLIGQGAELFNVHPAAPPSGEWGYLPFEPPAHLPEFKQGFLAYIEKERKAFSNRCEVRIDAEVSKKGALAASDLDETSGVEGAKRLANRRATDTECCGKFTLGRKPITRKKFLRPYQVLNLGDNVLIEARSFDRAEQEFPSWGRA